MTAWLSPHTHSGKIKQSTFSMNKRHSDFFFRVPNEWEDFEPAKTLGLNTHLLVDGNKVKMLPFPQLNLHATICFPDPHGGCRGEGQRRMVQDARDSLMLAQDRLRALRSKGIFFLCRKQWQGVIFLYEVLCMEKHRPLNLFH